MSQRGVWGREFSERRGWKVKERVKGWRIRVIRKLWSRREKGVNEYRKTYV
jgi:hypothetical protein